MSDTTSLTGRLVGALDPRPVLLDIGASAETPHIWMPVARHSIYVGFDPDLREMREISGGAFHKSSTINEAVTADPSGQVTFYLARAPQCSSTLRPDAQLLANYLHPDRFIIEREVQAKATTLNVVLDRLSLDRIDWLKIDTQGTDLRTYKSLRDGVRNRLLAVDVEPGLRGAYVDEDLFGDIHRDLTREGFWLSNANVRGFARVREATMGELTRRDPSLTPEAASRAIRSSPGWVECRYFRTIEWLDAGDFTRRDYTLLWVFTLSDGQFGFAADVALAYERRFSADADSAAMLDEAIHRIKAACEQRKQKDAKRNSLLGRVRRKIGRTLDALGK